MNFTLGNFKDVDIKEMQKRAVNLESIITSDNGSKVKI